jgi:hypothetical protein
MPIPPGKEPENQRMVDYNKKRLTGIGQATVLECSKL